MVATNELNTSALSDEQLLEAYKDQGVSVERGFRFLKDPLFYAESLYLKLPQRIMALLMVMTLSLLIYSLAEMRIPAALKDNECSIWNQKNKKTDRPTIRWVFMIFEDVLLLYTRKGQSVEKKGMNIREEHRIVLRCLGSAYEKCIFCNMRSRMWDDASLNSLAVYYGFVNKHWKRNYCSFPHSLWLLDYPIKPF